MVYCADKTHGNFVCLLNYYIKRLRLLIYKFSRVPPTSRVVYQTINHKKKKKKKLVVYCLIKTHALYFVLDVLNILKCPNNHKFISHGHQDRDRLL